MHRESDLHRAHARASKTRAGLRGRVRHARWIEICGFIVNQHQEVNVTIGLRLVTFVHI